MNEYFPKANRNRFAKDMEGRWKGNMKERRDADLLGSGGGARRKNEWNGRLFIYSPFIFAKLKKKVSEAGEK